MIHFLKILSLIPFFFLGACVSLLPEPGKAPKRIWLNPAMTTSPLRQANTQTIAITRPTTTHMLDSERLQVRNLKGALPLIDQIANVEWQDHLPLIVQRHLVQSLTHSKKFKAVGFDEDSFKPDVVLETDIQSFDVVILKDKIYAEVTLSTKLLDAKGRCVRWQKTISSNAPIAEHTLLAFVEGLTKAYENVLYQITQEVN